MTTQEGDEKHMEHSAKGLPCGQMDVRFPGMAPGEWHAFKPWGGLTYTNTYGLKHRVRAHYLPDSGSVLWNKDAVTGATRVSRIRISFILRTNSKTSSAYWLMRKGAMLANKARKHMLYRDKIIDLRKESTKDTLASHETRQEQLVNNWEVPRSLG